MSEAAAAAEVVAVVAATTTLNEVQQQSGDNVLPAAESDAVDKREDDKIDTPIKDCNAPVVPHHDDQAATTMSSQQSTPEPTARLFQTDRHKVGGESSERKKDDEKLGIYKALAIKLKKELVKTRDELQKLQAEYEAVGDELRQKVSQLESTLDSERVIHTNTSVTLEATCKNLKSQLETAEADLQSLQTEFDNYKIRATKIMQQNNFSLTNSNRALEEDRYKQLRALNEEQKLKIADLSSQLRTMSDQNKELEQKLNIFKSEVESSKIQADAYDKLESKCNQLAKENEQLKQSLKQSKERPPAHGNLLMEQHDHIDRPHKPSKRGADPPADANSPHQTPIKTLSESDRPVNEEESVAQVSPSASLKDENQTNSSSSIDSSTYGYVHIKPTAFEIISRTSVLEDAQNQIDNLTKAYLDSESTNSLLTEQVCALKEEIRRLQRGNERLELANNLEYLKNVIFKFLSLDSGQVEQRQRLVPVLSTVLKLSPDETQKLNSLTIPEKGGMMAGSFFKL